MSGHARKPTDRGTHILEMAEGATCQDTQGNRPTEVHSRPGDDRGRDLHQENPKTLIRVSQRLFNLANEIYLA